MIKYIINIYYKNNKLIFILFKIFWIIVFLLYKYGSETAEKVPEFIYVNF